MCCKTIDHIELIPSVIAEEEETKVRNVFKLLILGPGESGKSTFVKQMQILNMNGFSFEEMENKKKQIYHHVQSEMAEIVRQMTILGIPYQNEALKDIAEEFLLKVADDYGEQLLSEDMAVMIRTLWSDAGIKECYRRRDEYQLTDSAKYFFDEIDRISKPVYSPTNDDILQVRVTTIGVVCVDFAYNDSFFRIYDAGGQRSQRKKWIQFFDDINAMIFIAALSEYNQRLREDHSRNRMTETFDLFKSTVNLPTFANAGIILFLNKTDLFREKIQQVPLKDYFSSFKGEADFDMAVGYLKAKFKRRYKNKSPLYIFETCATNTDQISRISDSVFQIIIDKKVDNIGMLK